MRGAGGGAWVSELESYNGLISGSAASPGNNRSAPSAVNLSNPATVANSAGLASLAILANPAMDNTPPPIRATSGGWGRGRRSSFLEQISIFGSNPSFRIQIHIFDSKSSF